jgi:hypothetical protein
MKIWDINPGYLSRQQLLAEHSELHVLMQLIQGNSDNLSKMKPTLARWIPCPSALALRHAIVTEEMRLREIEHKSDMEISGTVQWPEFVPDWRVADQFLALQDMEEQGRIPRPHKITELWQHHAYSVMARDIVRYKELQTEIENNTISFDVLATYLVETLRTPSTPSQWDRVVKGMWHPCQAAEEAEDYCSSLHRPKRLFSAIQYLSSKYQWPELWHSTALCELPTAVRD